MPNIQPAERLRARKSQQESRLKVTLIPTDVNSPNILSGFETIAPKLYNMEPDDDSEMTVNIDVDLYQMENFY